MPVKDAPARDSPITSNSPGASAARMAKPSRTERRWEEYRDRRRCLRRARGPRRIAGRWFRWRELRRLRPHAGEQFLALEGMLAGAPFYYAWEWRRAAFARRSQSYLCPSLVVVPHGFYGARWRHLSHRVSGGASAADRCAQSGAQRVCAVFGEAREAAHASESAITRGEPLGLLHGVPSQSRTASISRSSLRSPAVGCARDIARRKTPPLWRGCVPKARFFWAALIRPRCSRTMKPTISSPGARTIRGTWRVRRAVRVAAKRRRSRPSVPRGHRERWRRVHPRASALLRHRRIEADAGAHSGDGALSDLGISWRPDFGGGADGAHGGGSAAAVFGAGVLRRTRSVQRSDAAGEAGCTRRADRRVAAVLSDAGGSRNRGSRSEGRGSAARLRLRSRSVRARRPRPCTERLGAISLI